MGVEADTFLLRRFEPIVRYTKSESFFPADAAEYVRSCGLWARGASREARCLAEPGTLTLDTLSHPPTSEPGAIHYLLRPREPVKREVRPIAGDPRQLAEHYRDAFRVGLGRLARVGYHARVIDAAYSLTLLARGRVPGRLAAEAIDDYRGVLAANERYCYYGRVVREGCWTVLQYWFFYHFDNWRSGFFGANDHDADWEMVSIFLDETPDGESRPEWVVYSCHNEPGDEIRCHWGDSALERAGEHPVVYAGAGSHAGYFASGEYLSEFELPLLAPLSRAVRRARRSWIQRLGDLGVRVGGDATSERARVLAIPFIDYARGDGLSIGPGEARSWSMPCLLNPTPAWVASFRGLWGLYARDPCAAEDAPAGPMYNRDGTPRRSWYDPVGWAGLDQHLPTSRMLDVAVDRRRISRDREATLQGELDGHVGRLESLAVEAGALAREPHLTWLASARMSEVRSLGREVERLRAEITEEGLLADALGKLADRLGRGEAGSIPATSPRRPRVQRPGATRFARLTEVWAAASVGLVLVGAAASMLLAQGRLGSEFVAFVGAIVLIEAGLHAGLSRVVGAAAAVLAVTAAAVILYEFVWLIALLAILVVGGYVLWGNLREIWR